MKDFGYILAIIGLVLYSIVGGIKGCEREQQIKEALYRDSVNVQRLNSQIKKMDSTIFILKNNDSLQSVRINQSLKKFASTKKKYEKVTSDMPFLPEL